MNQDNDNIINLNITRAFTTLDDAKFLIDNNKFYIAVNRIYYAAFYMISAFAIKDGFETSKHIQLIAWFNKNYIATGKISIINGKSIMRLFELRNKADYDIYASFSKEETEDLFDACKNLLAELKYVIDKSY